MYLYVFSFGIYASNCLGIKTKRSISVVATNTKQPNTDLFTAEELLQLTMTLITDLSKCRTKIEQFQVVSNIAIKFVYAKPNDV